MKKYIVYLLLLVITASCGQGNNKSADNKEQRIVCLAKEYNEIIFELGAQKNIVGVDLSSTYPDALKSVPKVGYHRALSAEAILAEKPTLIIHDNNVGPEHVIKQLKDLGIPMKTFADSVFTIDQTKALIREIGAYFNKNTQAESLCTKLDADMGRALDSAKNYTDVPKVMIIHFGQANNVYLTMTDKNIAANIIKWAGGIIPLQGDRAMIQLSAEAVAKTDPDVILLTDYGYDRLGSIDKIKELPGVAQTKAAKNNRIYRVEEHDMVYLGSRTGENVLKFEKMIHQHAAGQ
jgi:iron complex transport system substrate-binding protein